MKLPSSFDLHALEVFIVTAEQGGMTQSAKVLHMTQSAVSQIIAGLEGAIGTRLFDRSVRPIILTAAGRILLERGRQIIQDMNEVFREAQTLELRRLASLTIAMSDSMSTAVGSNLYKTMNELSSYWRFWSGLSPSHRAEFLSHNIDIIISASGVLDDVSGLRRYPVVQEPYVLAFPKSYEGPMHFVGEEIDLPFVRFSQRSATGAQIERQMNRLRLTLPFHLEFDRSPAHTMAIADGLGWGVTTPLCLMETPEFLPRINIVQITRGAFSRHFNLIVRSDTLGDVPEKLSIELRRILREESFPQLSRHAPWLQDKLVWKTDSEG